MQAPTSYHRETLYAAIDFHGRVGSDGAHVCGYAIWEFDGPNTVGLTRLEENVVDPTIFAQLPREEATRLLAEFRCPDSVKASIFGLSNP